MNNNETYIPSPSMAPTAQPFNWREAQMKRAIGRSLFMGIIVVAVAMRVLWSYVCDRRRRRVEEMAAAEREKQEKEQRRKQIETKLQLVKWSDTSTNGSTSLQTELPPADEDSSSLEEGPDASFRSDDDPRHSCAICFARFGEKQLVCQSNNHNCQHIFHKRCMVSWLLKNDLCPICRRPYLTSHQEEEQEQV